MTNPPSLPDLDSVPDSSRGTRSPIVAGILSIIPGLGQIYNGRIVRGISYFVLTLVMGLLIYWTTVTTEFDKDDFPFLIPVLIGILILFWLWVAVSAISGARGTPIAPVTGLVLVLLFTYILGWQVTEVNLRKFLTEFPDTYRILTRVIWPWRAAISRAEVDVTVGTEWMSPCPANSADLPQQNPGPLNQPWVIVEPACGEVTTYRVDDGVGASHPGTEITFHGEGFDPNEEVELYWREPSGSQYRPRYQGATVTTITDAEGTFDVTFAAPSYTRPDDVVGPETHIVLARQVASVGEPQLSRDFLLAVNRMIVTIFQALMATTFGIILAVPFSFLAARNLMSGNFLTRVIYYGVRFVLNVVRSIEPIIWAVIAVVWVGLGPFAGVIALTLHTIASLGKLYSEAIESIDPGPIEAINATGASRLQMIIYAIIPQVIPPFLSFTVYRWDINVRMSTIIGFVGGGGIGQILFQWIGTASWRQAGIAVWLIAITVSLMDWASSELRKRYV